MHKKYAAHHRPCRWSLGLVIALCGLCLLLEASGAPGQQPAQQPARDGLIAVTMPGGTVIMAELATTAEERARGLMFRPTLEQNRGMLFTFAEPQQWSFWMKNTRIPLDIIWMDGRKKIVHIARRVPTCSRTDDGCPQYQPNENALYVLELAAGSADAFKLERGALLRFTLPFDPRGPRPSRKP